MCSLLPYVTTKLTLYGPDKSNNLLEYNYIIVIDMEGNIKIYRLPKGRGMDQWKWYLPNNVSHFLTN